MKTGLVTFYHIHHYGALLQACATEQAVKRLGSECEIIDYYVNQDNRLFQRPTGIGSAAHDAHTALHYGPLKARYERFEEFARTRLSISLHHYESLAELRAAELPYDVILSGSDQIWNPKIFPDGKFDPVFFGAFSTKRKIAYAPSFGIPHVPESMEEELRGYLEQFSHLSVREQQGQRIVRHITGQDVPAVLDPTLLLTADQWDSMADHPANYPKGGYILCYCISRPGALTPYLERLHQETGLPVVQLCGIRQKVHPKAKQIMDAAGELFDRITDKSLLIRRLNITATHVIDEASAPSSKDNYEQLDLFTDYAALDAKRKQEDEELAREKKVQQAMLTIKKKFGKNAILKGMNLSEGATAKDRNEQIGGHKA